MKTQNLASPSYPSYSVTPQPLGGVCVQNTRLVIAGQNYDNYRGSYYHVYTYNMQE